MTGYYDFLSRSYDPVLGRFFAVDPAGQFGSPYVGMGNVPHMGIDPDGEFVFVFPTISWSKQGGLSIGFTAGVGIPGLLSVQTSHSYNFKDNSYTSGISASVALNTVYYSHNSSSGGSVGYTFGLSDKAGLPFSTNALTVGANYSTRYDQWSGNLSSWQLDKTRLGF